MAGNPAVADRMRKAAALMRERGLTVAAMAGWETRGRSSSLHPAAVIYHHTAAAVDVDRVLRDGRGDLPGPLCNWALHADGTWLLVAAGRANHAGVGTVSNSESYGIEATGPNHPRASGPKAFDNYDAYVAGVACIFQAEGWDEGRGWGHKETARPPGRKVDPAFDVRAFEADVRRVLAGGDTAMASADVEKILGRIEDVETKVEKTFTQVNEKTGKIAERLDRLAAEVAEVKALVQIKPGQ